MNKNGSCLMTLLILLTLISFFCLHIWRNAVLLFDTVTAKQEFQQHFYCAQGMLTWAIDLCKNNFDDLLDYTTMYNRNLVIELPTLNLNKRCFSGKVTYIHKLKNNFYYMHANATLLSNTKQLMHLSCDIHKKYDAINDTHNYKVKKWQLVNRL